MTRDEIDARIAEVAQAVTRGQAERQALLEQADRVLAAVMRLEGRLAELQEWKDRG